MFENFSDIFTRQYQPNTADYLAFYGRLQAIQQCVNSRADNKKENINKELLLLLDD